MTDTANLRVKVSPNGVSSTDRQLRQLTTTAGRAEDQVRSLTTSNTTLATSNKTLTQSYGALSSAVASIGFLASARQVLNLNDSYTDLNNRLRTVTESERDLIQVRTELLSISRDTFSSVAGNAEVYQQLAVASKTLGTTQEELLLIVRGINTTLLQTGAGAQQSSAALLQLSQAMGEGILRGEELNSIMSNTPGLANAIADALGVPTSALRKLGTQGLLTSEMLQDALLTIGRNTRSTANEIDVTLSKALVGLTTNATEFVGESQSVQAATDGLIDVIGTLGENLDVVSDVITAGLVVALAKGAGTLTTVTAATVSNIAAQVQQRAALVASTQATITQTQAEIARLAVEREGLALTVARITSEKIRSTVRTQLTTNALALTAAETRLSAATAQLSAVQATATTTTRALGGAMAFLGGPVGVAIIAAAALFAFSQDAGTAEDASVRLAAEVDALNTKYKEFNDTQRRIELTRLNQQFQDQLDRQLELRESLRVLTAEQDRFIQSGAEFGGVSESAGIARLEGQIAEVEVELNRLSALREAIFSSTGALDTSNFIDLSEPTSSTLQAASAAEKYIQTLRQQIAVGELTGVAAAQLAAEQRLGTKATEAEIITARELAATLYDQDVAKKALAVTERERQSNIRDQIALDQENLENISGSTVEYDKQVASLQRLADQGLITGQQLREGLLLAGQQEGNLGIADAYEAELARMQQATVTGTQAIGESVAQVFGPGGTLEAGIAKATADTIVYSKDAGQLFENLGRQIASTLLANLIQVGIQMGVNTVATTLFGTTVAATEATTTAAASAAAAASTAIGVANGAALTAAYTPAAIAASIATLGGAGAAGLAGIELATVGGAAAISSSSFAGAFENGGYIPAGQFGVTQEAGFEFVQGPAQVTSARESRAIIENLGNNNGANVNIQVINQTNGRVQVDQLSPEDIRIIVREETPAIIGEESRNERSPMNKGLQSKFKMERR